MASTQDIFLNGILPDEFKIVVVPYYGTAAIQEQGAMINVDQSDEGLPRIKVPSISTVDGSSPIISVTVIYQMDRILTTIPGINVPSDNRDIQLHFIKTGCVNFLTVGEPLNSLPECCDIHTE